ncbi:hypothetical protein GALMADRAFT_238207 [Galerina marginata CBS 339.88]|uniref:Uncharacterized protein n=1 Tax=Galerina marginata (strain CBS 339.88) TaxID=685588 RepID=A0A067TS10_GALM3|nr:hypothetical protein GALMADRAFT_238207 [Galerina marginata CBS 339.88]
MAPLFSIPPFHVNIGAQLIGCFVNLMLYTVELAAGWKYFHGDRSKRDHRILFGTVIFNLVMDTIGTFALSADVFTSFAGVRRPRVVLRCIQVDPMN